MKLADFLLELGQDPQKLSAFKQDPQQVMQEAGLSAADQAVLSSPALVQSDPTADDTPDEEHFAFEQDHFYVDFDDGTVVFMLYTALTSGDPDALLSVSTAWKWDDDSSLRTDIDPVSRAIEHGKTSFIIEGGSDIDVPSKKDPPPPQRNLAYLMDKTIGSEKGQFFSCEVLHLKVQVNVPQNSTGEAA